MKITKEMGRACLYGEHTLLGRDGEALVEIGWGQGSGTESDHWFDLGDGPEGFDEDHVYLALAMCATIAGVVDSKGRPR